MLYPLFLMVLLTFIVGCIAVKVRFSSVKTGNVSPKYYKLMEGENIPEIVIKSTRNFNNQFEIPVLFYVVCTLYISLGLQNNTAVMLAWLFVILRIVHSAIHLTYNHIIHRMLTFWAALLCVMGLWVNLLIQQM